MVWIIFILVNFLELRVIVLLPAKETVPVLALKCYSCQTYAKTHSEISFSAILQSIDNPPEIHPDCGGFSNNISRVQCKSEVCMKTVIARKGGERFLARYCMDPNIIKVDPNGDGCYKEHTVHVSKYKQLESDVCVCKNDLCNLANLVTVTFFLQSVVVTVHFVSWLIL